MSAPTPERKPALGFIFVTVVLTVLVCNSVTSAETVIAGMANGGVELKMC